MSLGKKSVEWTDIGADGQMDKGRHQSRWTDGQRRTSEEKRDKKGTEKYFVRRVNKCVCVCVCVCVCTCVHMEGGGGINTKPCYCLRLFGSEIVEVT